MNVNDAARKRREHRLFQDAHEAGENDQLHFSFPEQPHQFHFHIGLEPRPKFSRWKINIWNPKFARDIENSGLENIGDNEAGFRRQFAGTDVLKNRAAITSLARSKDSQPQLLHAPSCSLIFSSSLDVECPAAKGRIRISAPILSSAARSSASKVDFV